MKITVSHNSKDNTYFTHGWDERQRAVSIKATEEEIGWYAMGVVSGKCTYIDDRLSYVEVIVEDSKFVKFK